MESDKFAALLAEMREARQTDPWAKVGAAVAVLSLLLTLGGGAVVYGSLTTTVENNTSALRTLRADMQSLSFVSRDAYEADRRAIEHRIEKLEGGR